MNDNTSPIDAISILPAKLMRPDTKRTFHRERLFQSVETSRKRKVVWISGPAGSGKTTLAASYTDFHKIPCLWYQLDGGDVDIATFFYHLGRAAAHTVPRNQRPLPFLTPDYFLGIDVFAKRFFEQLALNLIGTRDPSASPLDRRSVIVLDNYQEIPEDSQFHTIINAGIFSLPRWINVIVLSRQTPPSAYSRLRAAGEINLLDWDDLRLTSDEFKAILKSRNNAAVSESQLSALYDTIDGWVAGLILLIESQGVGGIDSILQDGSQRNECFEYFAAEMFDGSSQEKQEFLLKTSFLTKMNALMAERLTGNHSARDIFFELNRKNYFTSSFASKEQAFQYHPLFKEFLQAKAEKNFSDQQLRDIRIRTAKVLEENGYGEDAVDLLCKAHNWDEAVRIILTHSPDLISKGRWQTLWSWIYKMPEALRDGNPWLIFWKGVCLVHSTPAKSMDAFKRAFKMFEKTKDAIGLFFSLSGMMDTLAYRNDSFIEYDELIHRMNMLLKEYPRYPMPEIEARVITSMLYAYIFRQPHAPEIAHWQMLARGLLEKTTDPELIANLFSGMIFYHLFSGEFTRARPWLESLEKLVNPDHAPPLAVQLLRNIQAFYAWVSAEFDKGRWATEDGIARANQTGVHFMDATLYGHGAAGALSVGDMPRAGLYLDRMLAILQKKPSASAKALYHALKAWQYLLEGDPVQTSVHADLALEADEAAGMPFITPASYLIKAFAMHRLKDDENAKFYLAGFWKTADRSPVFQVRFMGHLLESQMAFKCEDQATGRKKLSQAMNMGKKYGFSNGLFWEPRTISALCIKALELGIQTDYVQNLVRIRNLLPQDPVFHLNNWPWPLKIYTLGQFQIIRDGKPVKFSGKVKQKPIALLIALIAFGGKGVKVESLCDILWPDADGDMAFRSFETTLYRLRQLLRKPESICLSHGRLSLDSQICWVDSLAVAQMLENAENMWKACGDLIENPKAAQKHTEKAIKLTQQAVSLYKGDFFETESELRWLLTPNDRLKSKYIRGIKFLAGCQAEQGNFETAIEYYERALESDELAEEIYQELMTIHARRGQQSKVISTYNRCKEVFRMQMDVEPSVATRKILMKSKKRSD